jgi:hypothetical protein
MPGPLAGHARLAPGARAATVPTSTIQRAASPARKPGTEATATLSGAMIVATKPNTVAGNTAGAATRLASTATTLTDPDRTATRGVQASWAASGTATAVAANRGSHVERLAL